MIFRETPLEGLWVVELEVHRDERGGFARSFCREEFARHGLDADVPQANVSLNHRAGTLRGLHFQLPPHEEGKLVRCTRGSLYDAVVDLRPDSGTFGRSWGLELAAHQPQQLFVPRGFAHGFLTLEDDTEVTYLMSEVFVPGAGAGYRHDDPTFAIPWPRSVEVISERDRSLPLFDADTHRRLVETPA